MGDSGDSDEVGGLLGQLGQWQRAGLSVTLAHELHTFLESQERSRFEELRLELLLQEKSWAVEASRIQKDLGNFGISNASHGSQSGGSIEGLLPLEADALAMTWCNKPYRNRNIRKGISGVSLIHACPCKSALAQTGQLSKEIRSEAKLSSFEAPDAFLDMDASKTRTEQTELENFQDFRQHLRLLLAARASVMAAESSLQSFHAASIAQYEEGAYSASALPSSPSPESQQKSQTQQTVHVAHDTESPSPRELPMSASIRSAGLKQLMALHEPKPVASQISQEGEAAPHPRVRMVSQARAVDQKSSRLQEHLSSILTATLQDDHVDLAKDAKDMAEQTQVEEPMEGLDGDFDEINEEFANSFLQLAETRAKDIMEAQTQEAAAEPAEREGMAESGDLEQSVDTVAARVGPEASHPAEFAAHVSDMSQLPELPELPAGHADLGVNSAEPRLETDRSVQLSLADRALVRKTKLLQWQKASEFLRSDEPNSSRSWQLAEVLLEVDFARHRLREVLKHRTLLRRWHSNTSQLTAQWLKRKVQSAWGVVDIALNPPWSKDETLERAEKIERLWGSGRGKSHIYILTIYVEAVVAAYNAERERVLTMCGMSKDGSDGASKDCEATLHALEREVAKSLRSISECRRLLLTLFDKAAKGGMQTEQHEVKPVEAKVDEGRRNKWAEVYADLLHIEAKDSTTITLKTSQGVAWAKT